MSDSRVAVISVPELAALVRDAFAEAIAALPLASAVPSALLDRRALATALDVSLAAVDRLRNEPNFPEVRIGDAPRFEIDRVLEWLRARSEGPALRVISA